MKHARLPVQTQIHAGAPSKPCLPGDKCQVRSESGAIAMNTCLPKALCEQFTQTLAYAFPGHKYTCAKC